MVPPHSVIALRGVLRCVVLKGFLEVFDALTEKLGGVFDNLTGRGALSEKDVEAALREVRVALLEADALPVLEVDRGNDQHGKTIGGKAGSRLALKLRDSSG